MSTRFAFSSLIVCLIAISCAQQAYAQKPNPNGKPGNFEPGSVVKYYLWYENDTWYLRTSTKSQEHHFTGTIKSVGGRIKNVSGIGTEAQGGATQDFWIHKGDTVAFNLKTKGAMDGLNFQLGPNVSDVVFDLKIDGANRPEKIFIGRNSKNPQAGEFTYKGVPRGN